jgi:hypothetical protein
MHTILSTHTVYSHRRSSAPDPSPYHADVHCYSRHGYGHGRARIGYVHHFLGRVIQLLNSFFSIVFPVLHHLCHLSLPSLLPCARTISWPRGVHIRDDERMQCVNAGSHFTLHTRATAAHRSVPSPATDVRRAAISSVSRVRSLSYAQSEGTSSSLSLLFSIRSNFRLFSALASLLAAAV